MKKTVRYLLFLMPQVFPGAFFIILGIQACQMNQDKINFLKNDLVFLLKHLAPDAKGSWGAMNGQQWWSIL